MRCSDALDALMVVDLGDAMGNIELDAHLAVCERCRAVSDRLARSTRALADARVASSRRRGTRRAVIIAALPVAAGLAWAATSISSYTRPANHSLLATVDTIAAAPSVAVHLAPGQNAVVMPTSNPKVTVVWLY